MIAGEEVAHIALCSCGSGLAASIGTHVRFEEGFKSVAYCVKCYAKAFEEKRGRPRGKVKNE